jgi:hypothetical protein
MKLLHVAGMFVAAAPCLLTRAETGGCNPAPPAVASRRTSPCGCVNMKPQIERNQFGSITIDGSVFEHDGILGLNAKVRKQKKKLYHLAGRSRARVPERRQTIDRGCRSIRHGDAFGRGSRVSQAEGVLGRTATDSNRDSILEQRHGSRDRTVSRHLLRSRQYTGSSLQCRFVCPRRRAVPSCQTSGC